MLSFFTFIWLASSQRLVLVDTKVAVCPETYSPRLVMVLDKESDLCIPTPVTILQQQIVDQEYDLQEHYIPEIKSDIKFTPMTKAQLKR